MADPWAEFKSTLPAAPPQGQDPWAAYRAQEQAAGVKPQQAPDFVAPEPPPGVNIHMGNGKNLLSKGGGQYVEQSDAEARARASHGTGDVVEAATRGIPFVGGFVPRILAAGSTMGGHGDYASNLEAEQARASTFDQDNPKTSLGAKVAGGLAATAPLSGVAYLRGLLGMGATSLPGAIVRGAGSGLAQGVASGVGNSKDLTDTGDVLANAGKEGVISAALGGFIPAAIGGAGKVWDAARNRVPDALSSLGSDARKYVMGQLGDPNKVAALKSEASALGPEGMLADVSPEWQGVARGASARPGARDSIIEALTNRDAGKNARIKGTIDTEIGAAPIPSRIEGNIKANQDAIRPEYADALRHAGDVETEGLAKSLDDSAQTLRGPAQKAVQSVRKMLNVTNGEGLDRSAATLFETRQAIDGLIAGETNPKVVGILSEVRQQVDERLASAAPAIKKVDAKYAELARQREALQRGSQVLDGGKTTPRPAELADEIKQGALPQGEMVGPSAIPLRLKEGARAEIDRIVGQNANDVSALNRLLKGEGDWNRDKLRLVFGQDKADRILSVLDAERKMEGTTRYVVGNSATEPTRRFGDMLDKVAEGTKIPTDTTVTGLAVGGFRKAVDALSKTSGEAAAQKFAQDLGRLSVATGQSRDDIIDALLKRGVRQSNLAKLYSASGAGASTAPALVDALLGARSTR